MNPTGAAVNESLHPGRDGSIENDLGTADVNLVIIGVGHIELAKGGSEMVHNVNALHCFFDHGGIRDAADNDLDAPIANLPGFDAFLVVQCNNVMPIVVQSLDQRLAGKAGASRDQDSHQCISLRAVIVKPAAPGRGSDKRLQSLCPPIAGNMVVSARGF